MTTSLYIHIPFCERKCFYCSFVVAVGKQHQMDDYLDCLALEAGRYAGTPVETVYIGGGTPTFMTIFQLERLFGIIRQNFSRAPESELTIEGNPEDIEPVKARVLRELGVNRISMGIQTLNDHYLKYLGRCHDSSQALAAYDILRKSGFQNINVDLMYAFPQQTAEELEKDIQAITGLGSEHVSVYTLTVDENSRFHVQRIQEKDNREQGDQYDLVARRLEETGFSQYEISNFSRPGKASAHNQNYWRGGNYVGLGVGAHSHRDGERYWNISRFNDYLTCLKEGKSPHEGAENLSPGQRLVETLLLGLRMNEGVEIKKIEKQYGCALADDKKRKIEEFVQMGFLWQAGDRIGAAPRGRVLLDEISAQLF